MFSLEPETQTQSPLDNPEKQDGQHLHHYSDEEDVRDLLCAWHIEGIRQSEERLNGKLYPDSWHWVVLARKM